MLNVVQNNLHDALWTQHTMDQTVLRFEVFFLTFVNFVVRLGPDTNLHVYEQTWNETLQQQQPRCDTPRGLSQQTS